MSAPTPSYDPKTKKADEAWDSARRKPFWNPGKLAAATLAAIAAVAGLIANLQGITDFFQPSVNGKWIVTMHIKQSDFKDYVGMSSTLTIYLSNDGHNLSGNGEKDEENGRPILPATQRQQLRVTPGSLISGTEVTLNYRLAAGPKGVPRETNGQLLLKAVRAGFLSRQVTKMEGTFSGTAANTAGTIEAVPGSD